MRLRSLTACAVLAFAAAGVRAALTAAFFTEFRVEWKRDTDPAPGADKNDLRYVLGVGWKF